MRKGQQQTEGQNRRRSLVIDVIAGLVAARAVREHEHHEAHSLNAKVCGQGKGNGNQALSEDAATPGVEEFLHLLR